MSEARDSAQATDTPTHLALLDIPEGRIDEVLALVERLRAEEVEVAGYGTSLTTKGGPISGTGCAWSKTGSGQDFGCTDSDRS